MRDGGLFGTGKGTGKGTRDVEYRGGVDAYSGGVDGLVLVAGDAYTWGGVLGELLKSPIIWNRGYDIYWIYIVLIGMSNLIKN